MKSATTGPNHSRKRSSVGTRNQARRRCTSLHLAATVAAIQTSADTNKGTLTKPRRPAMIPAPTAYERPSPLAAKTSSVPQAANNTTPSSRGKAGGNKPYTEFGDATTRSAPKRACSGVVKKAGPAADIQPNPPTSVIAAAPAHPAPTS